MPLFMAKHNMKAKYITMQKVNYRKDEIINNQLRYHAQNSYTMSIKLIRMAQLIYLDQSEILAYNTDDKRKMR